MEGSATAQLGSFFGETIGTTRWDTPAHNLTDAQWITHQAALQAHLPFYGFEIQRQDPQGKLHWASISGTAIRDGQRRFTGYWGVGKNITARKVAEEAVKESSKNNLNNCI